MNKYQYKVQGVDYDVEIEEVEGNLAKVNGRTAFNAMYKGDAAAKEVIEEYVDSFYGYPETAYRNFDYAIDGNNILNFILAVKKYSPDVKTDEIEKSMIKKVEWFIKRWPEDAKMVSAEKYLNELKELFCK